MYLPKSDSARILVGTWWLIVTVLVATYSGSLIAFLTFPKIDDPILTVDNLLAHKDKLTWGFPNGSFLEEYLQSSENEQYRLLLSRSERHNDTEEADIIRRVKDGKHVFIDWRSSLRYIFEVIHEHFFILVFSHFRIIGFWWGRICYLVEFVIFLSVQKSSWMNPLRWSFLTIVHTCRS